MRVCVFQLAEVGKTSGVCVGDGSFSFAKGNGIWHTLSLPHHTHRADTAALFFSGPQNGPHHCVCLSQTPTFHLHSVSGCFQPWIYFTFFVTASEFCIGVLFRGVLWKPLMWPCVWFLPQCCENAKFSDREVVRKFLVIVLFRDVCQD